MKTAVNTAFNNSMILSFADFKEITKAKLAVSVVFSSLAGYLLGVENFSLLSLALLAFGGYCMVGASNATIKLSRKT